MQVIIMRASKTKLNKKKLFENYVAYLIKESDKRVLNERELLTLIAYTEGPIGAWIGKNIGKGLAFARGQYNLPTGQTSDLEKQAGETSSQFRERKRQYMADIEAKRKAIIDQRNKDIQNAGNIGDNLGDQAAEFGSQVLRAGKQHIIDPSVAYAQKKAQEYGQAARTKAKELGRNAVRWAGTKASTAYNAVTDPKNWKAAGSTIYNGLNYLANGGNTDAITYYNGHFVHTDSNGNPTTLLTQKELAALGYGNQNQPNRTSTSIQPSLVRASESVITRRGKRIKQKQIMSDLQEQMLIDYLKYKNKKRKK